MEKFKFKNKPELKFSDSKASSEDQKGKGDGFIITPILYATRGDCDIHTVSEPNECRYFGIDWTITGACIA